MSAVVEKLSYHRNGIGGEPFYVAIFVDEEACPSKKMLAVIFDSTIRKMRVINHSWFNPTCAVFCIEELAAGNIEFAHGNSWRGDYYFEEIWPQIKDKIAQ